MMPDELKQLLRDANVDLVLIKEEGGLRVHGGTEDGRTFMLSMHLDQDGLMPEEDFEELLSTMPDNMMLSLVDNSIPHFILPSQLH